MKNPSFLATEASKMANFLFVSDDDDIKEIKEKQSDCHKSPSESKKNENTFHPLQR